MNQVLVDHLKNHPWLANCIKGSMSRKGDYWDNEVVESFLVA